MSHHERSKTELNDLDQDSKRKLNKSKLLFIFYSLLMYRNPKYMNAQIRNELRHCILWRGEFSNLERDCENETSLVEQSFYFNEGLHMKSRRSNRWEVLRHIFESTSF